jgi:hypothetical protein
MATTATDIQKKTEHRRLFEERLAAELEAKKYNSPYLGEEEYDKVKSVVGSWDTLSKEEKKALGSKAYAWKSKYAVVGDGENALLIYASSGAMVVSLAMNPFCRMVVSTLCFPLCTPILQNGRPFCRMG